MKQWYAFLVLLFIVTFLSVPTGFYFIWNILGLNAWYDDILPSSLINITSWQCIKLCFLFNLVAILGVIAKETMEHFTRKVIQEHKVKEAIDLLEESGGVEAIFEKIREIEKSKTKDDTH